MLYLTTANSRSINYPCCRRDTSLVGWTADGGQRWIRSSHSNMCAIKAKWKQMKLVNHPVLHSKYFSINTKVTKFANNNNHGSKAFIGTEIGFSITAVQRPVFNKQQNQTHQLCVCGSLDTTPAPHPRDSSILSEVPFLPAQVSVFRYLRAVSAKKSHSFSLAQAELFTAQLSVLLPVWTFTLQLAKDFVESYKKSERSLATTSSSPVQLLSTRLNWLCLGKGSTGTFYLAVVTSAFSGDAPFLLALQKIWRML